VSACRSALLVHRVDSPLARFTDAQSRARLRQLTNLTDADAAGPPAWSPDGRRLAFITYKSSANRPVATIRANGTGLRTLFTRSGQNYGIDWSR
jgi:Tol biopolymer transport system component